MTARRLALAVALASFVTSCKRHEPPPLSHVWLGPSHACSLQKKSGELDCWGSNDHGQLGDGTKVSRALPGPVAVRLQPDQLALGAHHTCALEHGEVRCWGDGARGQLGDGALQSRSVPAGRVTRAHATLTGVTAIAAGGDRTCALAQGSLSCWGDGVAEATAPADLTGAVTVFAVSAGHTCAAFSAPKAVRCTGADDRGQSGGHAALLAGASVISLATGGQHSCAVLEDGSVQCWGRNDQGQLGDGTTTDAHAPVLVHGMPPAIEVRAGAAFTCARLRTNMIACWGDNRAYQLVDGTTQSTSKAGPVPGLTGAQELALAGDSACARLIEGGDARCWGGNASGQLGDGTTDVHEVPMPVKIALPKK